MSATRDVFVIMPFSATKLCSQDEWTEIFEQVFRPSIQACGYSCERAAPRTGSLIASIVERLRTARIVLADITDRNPNVFYELGVRHSLSKRTIIVCQDANDIPSDLRGYWSLQYGIRPAEVAKFREDIRRLVSEIEHAPDRSDSPVSDFLERENISISSFVQAENIKKLGALYTELSGNLISLGSILTDISADEHRALLSVDCLKLLLQTLYLDIGPDLLKQAYELLHGIQRVQMGNNDKVLVNTVLEATKELTIRLVEIRARLMSGDYSEPPTVSTMVWQTSLDSLVGDLYYKDSNSYITKCLMCSYRTVQNAIRPQHIPSIPATSIEEELLKNAQNKAEPGDAQNDRPATPLDDAGGSGAGPSSVS